MDITRRLRQLLLTTISRDSKTVSVSERKNFVACIRHQTTIAINDGLNASCEDRSTTVPYQTMPIR